MLHSNQHMKTVFTVKPLVLNYISDKKPTKCIIDLNNSWASMRKR